MARKIFINLPVSDLKRSVDFFTNLGFTFNAQFTDENATAMVISDDITVMLLVKSYFKTFIKKEISDAGKTAEVILAISAGSRQEVDEMTETALKSGGSPSNDTQDHGWMYVRSFQDPDGHLWEVAHMDEAAAAKQFGGQ